MRPYDMNGDEENDSGITDDNKSLGDFWMITDGFRVTLAEQKEGEAPTQYITIPRATFNKFIDWYMRDQTKAAA